MDRSGESQELWGKSYVILEVLHEWAAYLQVWMADEI